MPLTYFKIASTTVGSGGASSIDFTSIPQTYTDLVILLSARSTQASNWTAVKVEYNGSTTGYKVLELYGNGSTATSAPDTVGYGAFANGDSATANTFSNSSIYISNYTSSNYKSLSTDDVTENNATSAIANLWAHLWQNTAAITSIKLSCVSGNFKQYSTATLYGIKKD
jgi:hypothetical protein